MDTYSQLKAEVDGLFNLAKYRMEHGSYSSLILNDGSKYNDIVERLSVYGIDRKKAFDKLDELFAQITQENRYDEAIEEAMQGAELLESDIEMEM